MNIGGMTIPIPSLPQIVFLALSALAIVAALIMVTRRDAVHSAIWLVVVLFQLAGVYVLLNAPFLAVLQVLVYAGAILVLFLFVIMLLQLRQGPELGDVHQIQRVAAWPVGLLLGVELVAVIVLASGAGAFNQRPLPPGVQQHVAAGATPAATAAPAGAANGSAPTTYNNPGGGWTPAEIDLYRGEPRALGIELYSNFLLPFEIASFILLLAVVGAVVLARSEELVPSEFRSLGISLGRSAPPGSPQAIEIEKVLGGGQVPGVVVTAAAAAPRMGSAPTAQDALTQVPQATADRRSPPSTAADTREDKRP
jgi:NADH-quinone oxidoreductase subunit J